MELNPTKDDVPEESTVNLAGGEAFEPKDPLLGLYKVVINNLLEDTYYETDEESFEKVRQRFELAANEDPRFPLQLATYARNEAGLRDISQVLLALADNHEVSKLFIDEYGSRIMRRADEPAKVVSLVKDSGLFETGSLSRPTKRAIGDALHNYDSYQFAKYDSPRRKTNLKDVLNVAHNVPKDEEHQEIFERVIKGELAKYPEVDPLDPPETWEVIVSEHGSNKEAWLKALPRMGLFARLRNVRNMHEVGISSEKIISTRMTIKDYETGEERVISEDGMTMEMIENSMIWPFRFYQAYKALMRANSVDEVITRWIDDAIETSLDNIPEEIHDTFTAVDVSGSMRSTIANDSTLRRDEISSLFGAILMRHGSEVGAFATDFEPIRAHYDTPTLELQKKITEPSIGASTNGHLAIRYLRDRGLKPDRVIMFTDEQLWDSYRSGNSLRKDWNEYKNFHPECSLYIVDLASYGTLSMPENSPDVYNISGWTSKIIDFCLHTENPNPVIEEIKSI